VPSSRSTSLVPHVSQRSPRLLPRRSLALTLAALAACANPAHQSAAIGGAQAGAGGLTGTVSNPVTAGASTAGVAAVGGASAIGAAGMSAMSSGGASSDDDAGPGMSMAQLHGPFSEAQLQAQHCQPERPAFAYRASKGSAATAAAAPTGYAPIPCATYTDIGATESTLSVAKDGTVFYAPAFKNEGVGLLRSHDFGVTWDFLLPKLSNGGTHGRVQPYMYIDPATDRLFFATAASSAPMQVSSNGFDLSVSTDKGDTFTSLSLASDTSDWVKIFAGSPKVSQTQDYPNVIYASAPSPISTPIPIVSLLGLTPKYQSINRSLDGGKTWTRVAMPSLLASDVPGCDATEWLIYGSGAAASDGTVYLVLRRCRKLAIAVSSDDGATWQVNELPNANLPSFDTSNLLQIVANPNILVTEQLAVDTAGNVYTAWIDATGSLRLATSRDQAKTWSASVAVAAPEVSDVRYVALATQKPGTLALAYNGSTDGVKYHGYVAETQSAFDDEPQFVSATVNDPSDPLYAWGFEVGYLGVVSGADLNEIVQVKYAPNGDLWASFVKDMCESATTTRCHWDTDAHAKSEFQAVVGRLVHGVSERWGVTQPIDPDRYKVTCTPGPDPTMACRDITTSEMICESLASCVCNNCACPLLDCEKDMYCKSVRQCATKNNCRGIDCIVPCSSVALEAGDLMTTEALNTATCLSQNSCPTSCPLF
jgi:hypothetical protein